VRQLHLKPGWEGRNIDLALLRRLRDTIGEGCELAVMPYESESDIAHWQRLGFILTTPERQVGYLHLSLGTKPLVSLPLTATLAATESRTRKKIQSPTEILH
jgi:hypothetical protein